MTKFDETYQSLSHGLQETSSTENVNEAEDTLGKTSLAVMGVLDKHKIPYTSSRFSDTVQIDKNKSKGTLIDDRERIFYLDEEASITERGVMKFYLRIKNGGFELDSSKRLIGQMNEVIKVLKDLQKVDSNLVKL